MPTNLQYKKNDFIVETIFWDRDAFFIDFNSYWSRLAGSIAQKIAESTTNNWNTFNQIRSQSIKFLGINLNDAIPISSSPINILPVTILPYFLASLLVEHLTKKNLDELNILFQNIVSKSLEECKKYIKDSINLKAIETIKEINNNARQVLVTNDSKATNELFIKEAKIDRYIYKSLFEINKAELQDLLKNDSFFITKNSFLSKLYLEKGIKNILIIEDLHLLSFTSSSPNNLITIKIDGASKGNPGPAGIGIAFYKSGELFEEVSEFIGNRTNNFAEYTALIRALEISLAKGYENIQVHSDSELVVNQINKIYKIKDADIKDLFDKAFTLTEKFQNIKIIHVPREENLRADKLANKALKK